MYSDFTEKKDIVFLIKNIDNHIQRYLHSLYNRKEFQDCSLMNMWVSDFLYDHREKEIYQKDIEEEFFINRSTTSKMLSLMEEKELIRRTESDHDARLKKIELMPKGYELHELCIVIRENIDNKLTQNISQENMELFKTLCRQMIVNMDQ
ncbi:MAG: MarR family transcriptional regulator [Lachnospiraceae bacterium]|nr:MarR family transcriptional regulator [Robinsoniella sp.]MDY3767572.1 MarR family transcriptional regulator [Lachnospiraceae bacterium]